MVFQQRDYVVMGVLGVIVVVAVISGVGVSGNVVYNPTDLDFAVMSGPEDGTAGWTDCSQDAVTWDAIDNFCKSKDHSGAAPAEAHPCLHSWTSTRWTWDGMTPMQKGNSQRTAGVALTKVMCI